MTIASGTGALLEAGGAAAATHCNGDLPAVPPPAATTNGHVNGNSSGHQDQPRPLDASRLTITRHPNPSPPNFENMVFGHRFSPHMLVVDWTASEGWADPKIMPYGEMSISPAAPAFHYASGLFEGMKAYRSAHQEDNSQEQQDILLFRPDMNMARMNRSAARAGLPTFDADEMIKLLKALVRLDADYVPASEGQTLYLRPTLIGTTPAIGMAPPRDARLFCICSPSGPYFSADFKPVSLFARADVVRAWTGGTGSYKLAANYAPATVPAAEAAKQGYQQVLWLFGDKLELTEVGAMNFLLVFRKPDVIEIATAPLDDGYILPGVTRDSILTLLRMHITGQLTITGLPPADKLLVSERKVFMHEVIEASRTGSIVEAFGAGTAAIIAPVDRIGFEGKDYSIPVGKNGFGDIAWTLLRELIGRQTGAIEHKGWSVVC
ncbi:putative BAT2-branched-chain-amino-acid transaminase [Tilletiaria anomala UBC 951]|uniref:Putative BAT2-branched-chain-amino-acid transaminase n=1 Tax=Tilletiaria anomala (strain ATCC 24038 / CBS 436.72 / UBC 951) TaxID=1037660 RepID=A0A066WG85_TILAU|nr:putative BAT2-branched-chain-amino-acid transaminase [Tilletiaria anomala UBC 951]KDN52791.1 putative BAT2-branched-chain-amino-acid transaminase [Tilletiaria anomala UBC 951]